MRHVAVLWVVFAATMTGCQSGDDEQVLQERSLYRLETEPDGALGVLEARELVTDEQKPVVVFGRVGSNSGHATWDPGKAAFVICDPAVVEDEHEHDDQPGHDPDNCPFCQAQRDSLAQATALINVVDEAGEVVPIGAQKLLTLDKDQIVVVRGTGQIDGLGNLVVAADGVYVRE